MNEKTQQFWFALRCGNDLSIRMWLSQGPDLNAGDSAGESSLHMVAAMGDYKLCHRLVTLGAIVDLRSHAQRTPLHRAAATGSVDVCKILLHHGAEVHAKDGEGLSVLHHAAMSGDVLTCRLLVAAGAELDAVDVMGRSPLQLAIEERRFGVRDEFLSIETRRVVDAALGGGTESSVAPRSGAGMAI